MDILCEGSISLIDLIKYHDYEEYSSCGRGSLAVWREAYACGKQ